jgi:hypothetical protein
LAITAIGAALGLTGIANVDLAAVSTSGDPVSLTDALTADDTATLVALIDATIAVFILAVAGIVGPVGIAGLATVDNATVLT